MISFVLPGCNAGHRLQCFCPVPGIEGGAVVKTLPSILVLVLASAPVISGHHSFAAHYFEEQSVTIEGTLLEFKYEAPHAWVHLSVTDSGGAARQYAAEWANPNRLSRDGITKETLKAGDRLVVTGSPGRNAGENRIHLKRVERPSDGWNWRGGRRR
jgi:hypothetical protein